MLSRAHADSCTCTPENNVVVRTENIDTLHYRVSIYSLTARCQYNNRQQIEATDATAGRWRALRKLVTAAGPHNVVLHEIKHSAFHRITQQCFTRLATLFVTSKSTVDSRLQLFNISTVYASGLPLHALFQLHV